jgi:hypothetical protein
LALDLIEIIFYNFLVALNTRDDTIDNACVGLMGRRQTRLCYSMLLGSPYTVRALQFCSSFSIPLILLPVLAPAPSGNASDLLVTDDMLDRPSLRGGAVGGRHCATIRKVAGSIREGVIEILHWLNPFRTMALGSTQSVTEISTRGISSGAKGGRCVGLTAFPPCTDCLEIIETFTSWNLKGIGPVIRVLPAFFLAVSLSHDFTVHVCT